MIKYVLVLLAVLFLLLQYALWWAPDGFRETSHLKHDLHILKKTEERLGVGNKELEESVIHADSVEGRARSELGMVKDGEVFYRVLPKAHS